MLEHINTSLRLLTEVIHFVFNSDLSMVRFIFQKHSQVVLVGELGVDLVGDGQELDVCASKRFAHVTDLELVAVFRVVSNFVKQPFKVL